MCYRRNLRKYWRFGHLLPNSAHINERFLGFNRLMDGLPKYPPHTILPKCPPPRKVGPYSVFYSFALIMDRFFKNTIKIRQKNFPKRPLPHDHFSSKINFTLVYRPFFATKKWKVSYQNVKPVSALMTLF